MTRTIPLTRGYVATVDDEDYEWLSQFSWYLHRNAQLTTAYAARSQRKHEIKPGERRRTVFMHREVLGLAIGRTPLADHKDHDGLNNQRSNLRICTEAQNHENQRKTRGRSRYKGVYWEARKNKWMASIRVAGRTKYISLHTSEEQAGRAYDRAAAEHFGEFACLNFPEHKEVA